MRTHSNPCGICSKHGRRPLFFSCVCTGNDISYELQKNLEELLRLNKLAKETEGAFRCIWASCATSQLFPTAQNPSSYCTSSFLGQGASKYWASVGSGAFPPAIVCGLALDVFSAHVVACAIHGCSTRHD